MYYSLQFFHRAFPPRNDRRRLIAVGETTIAVKDEILTSSLSSLTSMQSHPTASILLLCGLPGSGKSTTARTISKCFQHSRNRKMNGSEVDKKCIHDIDEHNHQSKNSLYTSRFDKILLIEYDAIVEQELVRRSTQQGTKEFTTLNLADGHCNMNEKDGTRFERENFPTINALKNIQNDKGNEKNKNRIDAVLEGKVFDGERILDCDENQRNKSLGSFDWRNFTFNF